MKSTLIEKLFGGYYELVFDDMHYEQLVDVEKVAYQIYFKRKMELEQEFSLDK